MPYHYSFLWKVINWLLLYFLFYFIVLYYIFSTNKDIQKVRHRAEPFSLYQCPSEKHLASIAKGIHLTPKLPPATSAERILLVTRLNAAVGRGNPVLSFLNHFKVPIRIATVDGISGDKLPPLELGNGTGRFSVIIFQDYVLYDSLAKSDKVELLKYCRRHNVALISFLSPDLSRDKRDFELFSIKVAQKQNRLRIPQSSPIKFVGKSSTVLDIDQNWTLIQPMNNVTVILVAEEDNGSELAAAVLLRDPAYDTDHIVIGQIPDNWMVKIILLDSLIYMAPNIANRDLDRFIQIDIDDVFVGQSGTRFVPDDVKQLKQTQDDLRKYIDGFYFTLGFSGYFFRHGDSLEIRGDEELVASANEFYWFPHMWRHNHAHEYAEDYLLALMTQNRIFAENVQLRLLPGYAISPQHSGVYPSYDPLYRAWRSVWNISVTSTEEYPHLRPASARRGFIYSNISVIPRQTCEKTLSELIAPVSERCATVVELIEDITDGIECRAVPMQDTFGPALYDPDAQCLVLTEETPQGSDEINKKRQQKGFPKLDVHVVPTLDANDDPVSNESKLSSSSYRRRELGTLLREPAHKLSNTSPYIIGLIGGIASGKNQVSKLLADHGCHVIVCKDVAQELYNSKSEVRNRIISTYGSGVVAAGTKISCSKLEEIDFSKTVCCSAWVAVLRIGFCCEQIWSLDPSLS